MTVAVIDIGSNSGRVVVYQLDRAGCLRALAGTRAALRLVHDVDEKRRLDEDSMARAMVALRDFRAIARGAEAGRIAAVATAAIREAENGALFIDRVRRELGIRVEIIDGEREAYLGCVGALRGLDFENGLVFDLGGGSMQVTRVRGRRPGRSTSLPIGALRLSETFLRSDPPRPRELRRLREQVAAVLEEAGLPSLRRGEQLVGTGGTLRNLAKIDQRERDYPIGRVHGYRLDVERLRVIAHRLAELPLRRRDSVPGLSADRADSIVGGALAIEMLLDAVGAGDTLVSGEGVREGLAHELLGAPFFDVEGVRETSVASLTARFEGWSQERADRRRQLAAALLRGVERRPAAPTGAALDLAARVLDVGRSIDFFDRFEHAADILLASDLDGHSHAELAFSAAVLRAGHNRRVDVARLAPLGVERQPVQRAGVLLALADDLEERCPGNGPIAVVVDHRERVRVRVGGLAGWRPRTIAGRFQRTFGKPLEVIAR
jgi:exopolyphosphatase/guanosine-5'-triphosphate,3'-diphosphate pyrophosphatase